MDEFLLLGHDRGGFQQIERALRFNIAARIRESSSSTSLLTGRARLQD